ncbi:hydroxyphenylacetyl-CoA thioesterase PaaI [Thermodesulfatator autotrophicus]|uniref:Thioesterase domain-containing protein n=1 Tax=Thermodesulfatator autotrophicus TaxID=1795632 RepID=A0A177E6Z9_9BACT|nr:hydroxyphenylacetyl-CoA thioesterase PaaI [Thermodesulfatator autotrophicus]OAG26789.1 hypothetical protein TH606_10370 [Thermodesulfatator autotrophicus]
MTPEEKLAQKIAEFMVQNDQVAVKYNMEVKEVKPGYARVSMKVTRDMLNAVKIAHGGVIFSLADFAFAVASNSHGQVSVATNAHINYIAPAKEGDILIAEAREVSHTRRIGIYHVEIKREETLIAFFTGNVFRRDDRVEDWMKP